MINRSKDESFVVCVISRRLSSIQYWESRQQFISVSEQTGQPAFGQKPARICGLIDCRWNMLDRQAVATARQETCAIENDVSKGVSRHFLKKFVRRLDILHHS